MMRAWRSTTNVRRVLAVSVVASTGVGCSLDSLLNADKLPPNVTDPAVTETPQGAVAAYNGTIASFRQAFSPFVATTGLLGDELRIGANLGSTGVLSKVDPVDSRIIPEPRSSNTDGIFPTFQKVRGQATQAVGLLTRYDPGHEALVGHAYALEAYAEVLLAELYCSGIPLSTLDFDGGYTLKPGSPTDEVLTHAVALFDTASTLVGDSARLVHMAAVGKARALLGLGQYAAAAAAVAAVPDAYHYDVAYSAVSTPSATNFLSLTAIGGLWTYSVADAEGINGQQYISSGDPRSTSVLQATNSYGYPVYRPTKYATNGSSPLTLASGVEARLIEAEAALQAGEVETWLAKLNALRTDGTYDTTTTSPPDTLWHAGTGGIAHLKPLADPGTADGRVDLLFQERAFWLFLTGHRQGDLRRLIRQYGREEDEVYPSGVYVGGQGLFYGSDVTLPAPDEEKQLNPLYTGCISRDA